MVEKKRSLNVSTNFIDFADLDEQKKDDIKKYFPTYFSDDLNSMKEECEEGIMELRRAIDECKDDERLQNYIVARSIVMKNQCPYLEISELYDRFVQELKGKYPNLDYIDKPRYSMYFANKDIPSLRAICKALEENHPAIPGVLIMKNTSNQELFDTLKSIYNFYRGRIPRAEQLLLYYPDYLTRFFELQRVIMTEDGPLPLDQRYFLALLSVSCYGCDYLYNLLIEGYVEAGGDETWLDANSTTLPAKLKRLIDTNYDLAYQPWTFLKEKQHQFAGLLKEPDAWSRLELMQVLLIFSFYHSFCCYIYTMGILPELDFPRDPQKDFYLRADDDTWKSMMKNSPLMKTTNQDILEELDKLAKKAEEEEKDEKKNDPPTSEKADESLDYGEDLSFEGYRNNSIYYKFFGEKKIDFLSTRKRVDNGIYEWKMHGYPVLDEDFPEIAKFIDSKYDLIHTLTLSSFAEKEGVQTQPFRKALDYYIQNIHGYEYMDFDYQMINKLIHKDLKLAIKTIGSTPQNLNHGIINRFPAGFKTYEFCHVALIVMEAKFQIELMYGIIALESAKI